MLPDVRCIIVVTALQVYLKPFFSLRSKFPQKDLEMLFPGMSADFTSENFSAAWYLIENHSTTRSVDVGLLTVPGSMWMYFTGLYNNVGFRSVSAT